MNMNLDHLDQNRADIAARIRSLRADNDFSAEDMALATGRSVDEYLRQESGEQDLTFTFIFKCARKLGVDVVELLTGESPHLKYYSIIRANEGLPIDRHRDFNYIHKAPYFKGRLVEPFLVTVPYQPESQHEDIHLSYHTGQELDYVIKGHLRFSFEGRIEEVGPGDTLLYDSGRGHGIIAIGGEDALILAVVIPQEDKPQDNEIM